MSLFGFFNDEKRLCKCSVLRNEYDVFTLVIEQWSKKHKKKLLATIARTRKSMGEYVINKDRPWEREISAIEQLLGKDKATKDALHFLYYHCIPVGSRGINSLAEEIHDIVCEKCPAPYAGMMF